VVSVAALFAAGPGAAGPGAAGSPGTTGPGDAGQAHPSTAAQAALQLGWVVAELRSCVREPATADAAAPHPDGAPGGHDGVAAGARDADASRRMTLAVNKVEWSLWELRKSLEWPESLAFPDVATCRGLCAPQDETPDRLGRLIETADGLHDQCATTIVAGSFAIGTAYTLGSELAALCRLTSADEVRAAFADVPFGRLYRGLTDLSTCLPPHAAHAVRRSLLWWRDAVRLDLDGNAAPSVAGATTTAPGLLERRRGASRLRRAKAVRMDRVVVDPNAAAKYVAALPRQGEKWRSVLTGDRLATEALQVEDYVNAAKRTAEEGWVLIRKATRFLAPVVAFLTVVAAVLVAVTLAGGLGAGGKSTALFVAVGGYLASVWRVVSRGVSASMRIVEAQLWQAELDLVIAEALTIGPGGHDDPNGIVRATIAAASSSSSSSSSSAGSSPRAA
jgi:hypothetical protein